MSSKDPAEPEVTPEAAQKLLMELLRATGVPIEPDEKETSDAVDKRPNAKPLLGTDTKRAGPPMPSVGRGPRKKT